MENEERKWPEVIMICLDCTEEEAEQKRAEAGYENLKVVHAAFEKEGLKSVFGAILDTDASYVCFAEPEKISDPNKICRMVKFLEDKKTLGSVFCRNEYTDEAGEHIAWMRKVWMEYLDNMGGAVNGTGFLLMCLLIEENLFGNLESCMLRREIFIDKEFLINHVECSREEERQLLIFECMYGMGVGIIKELLVKNVEKKLAIEESYKYHKGYKSLRDKILRQVYKQSNYSSRELPLFYRSYMEGLDRRSFVNDVEKKITFFHGGPTERYMLEPIAEEAEKRGYEVIFSQNLGEKAEIGIYCSHVGSMQMAKFSAKFSIILFHDMTQGDLDWPDLWNDEPWDEFDMGILPGKVWTEHWRKCSGFFYAHPKLGVYEAGYPKGDYACSPELAVRSQELKSSLNLKYDRSILYAPAWENDDKEDDFVKALCDLPVNLLIKQGAWRRHPIVDNVRRMREMHEGKYDNVYYIEDTENIMHIYPFCDLVVSEESGAMTEALLFQKPSVAVMDWLIPDQNPPRPSSVPYDYVYKCKKAQLREQVETALARIEKGIETVGMEPFFSHIGKACSNILDLIEYYIGESENADCLSMEVIPIHRLHGLWD